MGLLDQRTSRNAFIKGNLALLQLQSLTVGSVAGLFAFGLGVVVHPTTNNPSEIALMITASMLCAAMSSFVLGGFMCGLVLICRRYRINPGKASYLMRCCAKVTNTFSCQEECFNAYLFLRSTCSIDNIACPLASSFGDLVTLVILAGCAVVLKKFNSMFIYPMDL